MHAVREEIQALRALAVVLVVLYHYWPGAAPAGFVGVDVFFAISGFLITDMLLREVTERGTVSLPRFWARRARRLLPAALLTIAVCAVATIAFVPVNYWQQFFGEMRASAAYAQNCISRRPRSTTSRPTTGRPSSTSGRCRPRSSSTWCGRCSSWPGSAS